MKLSLSVTAILACCSYAGAQENWLEAAVQEREATLRFFAENRRGSDAVLQRLIDELPTPPTEADTSMPEGEPGETVAVSDGGMLFDVLHARMVYIHNVRVNDPRVRLRCTDRLYIQLPEETLAKGKEEAKEAVTPGTVELPRATEEDEVSPPEAPFGGGAIEIAVHTAMVNTVLHKALLIGNSGSDASISIVQGDTHMILQGANDAPAQAMIDDNGDIYITAGAMDLQWKDDRGNLNKLTNSGGTAYYRAADGKLLLTGESQLEMAEGSIACTKEICVTLKQEPREHDEEESIMPQFGSVRIVGVNGVTAQGNVRATRVANATSPAAAVTGESLVYDGTTGECAIRGENTTLQYGENTLSTNGSIQLAGNGDITLQGDTIGGQYTRPAEDKDAPALPGTFSTSGKIHFNAANGIVSIPSGINIKDELCDFNVGGAVEIKLAEKPGYTPPERSEMGMINTAIAAYSEVESIKATGGISLRYVQGAEKQELSITADEANIDLANGSAALTSSSAGKTQVTYAEFNLTAESEQGDTALVLDPEGNLSMHGEKLTATLPTNDGPATVHCTDALTLVRTTGRLELGAGARVEAPQGRLTANGPLYITLSQGPEGKARPLLPQFPHLVYNYNGLQQADTEQGGTVQSKQASMRCSGKIHVAMSQTAGDNSPVAGIELATAEGDIAVTGKDATGRMLTAYGDKLSINGKTGEKCLSGSKVILQDKDNTHTASGAGAAIILDKKNNVRVTGAKQSTSASNLRNQIEKQQKSKK